MAPMRWFIPLEADQRASTIPTMAATLTPPAEPRTIARNCSSTRLRTSAGAAPSIRPTWSVTVASLAISP